MVQRDLRDGYFSCVCSGGGVETCPPEWYFENSQLDVRLAKGEQGNRGYLLEESRQRVYLFVAVGSCSEPSRTAGGRGQLFTGCLDVGELDALGDGNEVR